MNKLATIQKVYNIRKHPNADKLKLANVMGYKVVTASDIKENSHVVYLALDSILPEIPPFEFMRKEKFRVKMVKLRGEISNGLIVPLDNLIEYIPQLKGVPYDSLINMDVSSYLGVQKYSKPIPAKLAGESLGAFPTHIASKTDETRLEGEPLLFDEFVGDGVYITLKLDGTSSTIFKQDGVLRVCSRNLELKETESNTMWKIVEKYNLKDKLPEGFCIQGEVIGESIQKNPMGLKGQDFNVFNVVKERKLLSLDDSLALCEMIGVPFVPIIYRGIFNFKNLQELKDYANSQKYSNDKWAEGIVVRPVIPRFNDKLQKELSVKIISENYKD